MEYVIKQKRYSIFDFRFVNYTSELLIFETFNTNTNSHVENYQPLPLCVTNHIIYNGCDSGQVASSIKCRYL